MLNNVHETFEEKIRRQNIYHCLLPCTLVFVPYKMQCNMIIFETLCNNCKLRRSLPIPKKSQRSQLSVIFSQMDGVFTSACCQFLTDLFLCQQLRHIHYRLLLRQCLSLGNQTQSIWIWWSHLHQKHKPERIWRLTVCLLLSISPFYKIVQWKCVKEYVRRRER